MSYKNEFTPDGKIEEADIAVYCNDLIGHQYEVAR